jgi:hypothetical protein
MRRPWTISNVVATNVCNDDTFEQVKQLRDGNNATLVAVVHILLGEAVKALDTLHGLPKKPASDARKGRPHRRGGPKFSASDR